MSYHEYQVASQLALADHPFYALIMAAMQRADTVNGALLRSAFPGVWAEVEARYNAPGARLEGD